MKTRRQFLQTGFTASAVVAIHSPADGSAGEWKSLFDGSTLNGWKAIPRIGAHRALRESASPVTSANLADVILHWHEQNQTPEAILNHTGDWKVEDGAIVGGQSPAGCRHGAYLITEGTYGDFELEYEMRPDWQTDTGVLVRQHPIGSVGFQILCDHRPNGGIGGIFTNGLGGYLAAPFFVDGDRGPEFRVENFREGEIQWGGARGALKDAAAFEEFREVWKVNEWNHFRVRCVGADPVITTWVNGLKIGSLNSADPGVTHYDPSMIQRLVGPKGHIGLEIHSNTPGRGWDQWAKGAVSRWRNIRIREVVDA